jgi:RsiW-degrading membrane proteinase PrsW (M82 family)
MKTDDRPPARPTKWRRWAAAPVVVGGIGLYELVRRAVEVTGNPNLVPALLLLGAAVIPTAFVALISGRRIALGVGAGVIALTALLGGVLGVVTAGSLEFGVFHADGGISPFAIGVIEEMAKLLVPLAVLVVLVVRGRAARPADGLVLGVAAGAGFAVLETMGYAFVALVESRGDLAVVNTLLFDRGVLSPGAHMAWTGLAATALWRVATARRHWWALAEFFGVFVLVGGLHAAWDSTTSTGGHVGLAIVSLALLTGTALLLSAPRHRVAGGRDRPPREPVAAALVPSAA